MCCDWRLGKVPLMVAIVAQLPGYMRLEASPEGQPAPCEPLPLAGIMASDKDNSPAPLGSQPVSVLNDPPKRIRCEVIVASLPFITPPTPAKYNLEIHFYTIEGLVDYCGRRILIGHLPVTGQNMSGSLWSIAIFGSNIVTARHGAIPHTTFNE